MIGPAPRRRHALRTAALFGAAVELSGCRLTLSLDVEMDVDGVAAVEFVLHADEALAAAIAVDELRLDDLAGNGWEVSGPQATDDGGVQMALRADQLAPDQLAAAVEQLDAGRLFEVRRAEAVAAVGVTDYALEIAVLADAVADDFSDDELRAVLDGRSFGTDRAELEALAGSTLEEAVVITARVAVPENVSADDLVIVDESVTIDLDGPSAAIEVSGQVSDSRVFLARGEAAAARSDVDDSWRRLVRFWGLAGSLAVALLLLARLWRGRGSVQAPTI